MQFVKYPSLTSASKQSTIDHIQCNPELVDETWIATEKLHGANFSIWCDGTETKCARRSAFIGGDESFFGWNTIKDKYIPIVEKMQHDASEVAGEQLEIVVFGELYGGGNETKPVQREIQYNNGELQFRAFDMKVAGKFVSFTEAVKGFQLYGMPHVVPLLTGKFDILIGINPDIKSNFSDDGKAEGVTLRPNNDHYFGNGSRVMLKKRTNAFLETKSGGTYKKCKNGSVLLPNSKEMVDEMLAYVTIQRVSNVASHEGITEFKDFGKLLGMTFQDILKDYRADSGKDPKGQEDFKTIQKEVQKPLTLEVRKFLQSRSEL